MIDPNNIFIVSVQDDGETFDYQYNNYSHAKQHYDMEKIATIYEYAGNGNYHYVESKIA